MEEFQRLERELNPNTTTAPLTNGFSSRCLYDYNSSALLDDSAAGTVFPTGENLPATPPHKAHHLTAIESDVIESVMSGSIIITSSSVEDLPREVFLDISDQECTSSSPSPGIVQSPLPSPAAPRRAGRRSSQDSRVMKRNDNTITSYRYANQTSSLSEMHDFPNGNFNNSNLKQEFSDLEDINPTLPMSIHPSFVGTNQQLKQEDSDLFSSRFPAQTMCPKEEVSVILVPPPPDKKKNSTCKVVNDKVYVKLGMNFWLRFCGSIDALNDTEVCLETSYSEPDNRDVRVQACHLHWEQHTSKCSKDHEDQSFLCTGGQVPIHSVGNACKSYTPLSTLFKNKSVYVNPKTGDFDLKVTALCRNSCQHHKDNGKNIGLTVWLRSVTNRMREMSGNYEFRVTCCESPTRDSKPPASKRRRTSSSSTINFPMTPSCLMSPRSQSSSPASSSPEEASALARNFTVMTPPLSREMALRARDLLSEKMGFLCRVMEDKPNL